MKEYKKSLIQIGTAAEESNTSNKTKTKRVCDDLTIFYKNEKTLHPKSQWVNYKADVHHGSSRESSWLQLNVMIDKATILYLLILIRMNQIENMLFKFQITCS